jgi:hypothetical protein
MYCGIRRLLPNPLGWRLRSSSSASAEARQGRLDYEGLYRLFARRGGFRLPGRGLLGARDRTKRAQGAKGEDMKALTSILTAGAILAVAAQTGTAATVKHTRHGSLKVGYGPYAYLGSSAQTGHSTITAGVGPYAFLGNAAPVR